MNHETKIELPVNLDCPNEVETWMKTFDTHRGVHLAGRLGLQGPDAETNANLLADYALNRWEAMKHRLAGNIAEACTLEATCESIYAKLPANLKW